VGLSANATADRVRRLRRIGVIRGFIALVDPGGENPHRLTVLIDVRLRPDTTAERFETGLHQIPSITEALHVTGSFDYLIRATIPDAPRPTHPRAQTHRRRGRNSHPTRAA